MVDDEVSARENLGELLTEFCPEVEILGEATHVDTAIKEIEKHEPDLVFLDIEMPQKSGFELIEAFSEVNFHIIFVTAYDQYALKAFDVSAIDYLLKPVDIDRLQEAVHKVMLQQKRQNYEARFKALKTNTRNDTFKKLAIPQRNDYAVVNIDDIISIEADGMYSKLSVSDKRTNTVKHYTYSKKLRYFEGLFQKLPHLRRVHRSWMINTHNIHSYSQKSA